MEVSACLFGCRKYQVLEAFSFQNVLTQINEILLISHANVMRIMHVAELEVRFLM